MKPCFFTLFPHVHTLYINNHKRGHYVSDFCLLQFAWFSKHDDAAIRIVIWKFFFPLGGGVGRGGGGRKWVNLQLTICMLLITFKVYLSQVTWITRSIAKMILLENHPLQKWQRKPYRYLGKTLEGIFFSLKVTRSYCIHCKLFSQFNFLFFH